jgi:hypothetical protein
MFPVYECAVASDPPAPNYLISDTEEKLEISVAVRNKVEEGLFRSPLVEI